MQFFLANLHADRLSGPADTSTETDSYTTVDSAPVSAAVTDEAHQAPAARVLSPSR